MSRLEHLISVRALDWPGSYLSVEVQIKQHFSGSKVNTELTVLRSEKIFELSEEIKIYLPTVVSSTFSPNLNSIVTDLMVASVVMENLSKVFSDLSRLFP